MAQATPLDRETTACLFRRDFILSDISQRSTRPINEVYHVHETLGEGQFGVVRRVVHKETNEAFACKTMPKRKLRYLEEIDDIRREITVMIHLMYVLWWCRYIRHV